MVKEGAGTIQLFLAGCLLHSPEKVLLPHEIRQADGGDPLEGGFVSKIHSPVFAPPKALQGRHHILKKAVNGMTGFIAHFQGVGQGIEDAYRRLIFPALLVGVSLAANGDVVHRRHCHNGWLAFGQVKLLVFLFEIEGHRLSLLFFHCTRAREKRQGPFFLTRGLGCVTIPGTEYCARRRVGIALEPYPQAFWRYGAPVLFLLPGGLF